jgi:3-dehydroquinate synthase
MQVVQRDHMPSFAVETSQRVYQNVVERGIVQRAREFVPERAGKCFVVTTEDVWRLHGEKLKPQFPGRLDVLFFPGGEANKRFAQVEILAEQMVERGADRGSIVIGFGGGIVTDVSGFLAAIFMRGVPVLQIPTTLLAQVDAATGGKTGVNLRNGKNMLGSFHQPLAVLIDPEALATLPAREYRAGLFEVVKCGIIRDRALFELLEREPARVLAMEPAVVDDLIAAAVKIKAEVVTADEREGDLRRILNFGHTVGHAIEAETEYVRLLHGEAVAWGMLAATRLAELSGMLAQREAERIRRTICHYGPLPPVGGLNPDRLLDRLASDKKTLAGKVHFVLPTAIGDVKIVSDLEQSAIRKAIAQTLEQVS